MSTLWQAKYKLGPVDGSSEELAVSLRRALFTKVTGAAVRTIRIKDAPHEFSVLPGVKEDTLELARNLSKVKLAIEGPDSVGFEINKRGPGTVTASDIQAGDGTHVLEPEQHLATLGKDGWLVLSGAAANGQGYRPAAQDAPPGTIQLDCNFSPVKRAVCEPETDTIVVSLATDGRASTRDALMQALDATDRAGVEIEEVEPEQKVPAPAPSTSDYTKVRSRSKLPPLTGMQRAAFDKFLNEELPQALGEIFPVTAADGSAELDLLATKVEPPTASPEECLDTKSTFAGRFSVSLALRRASGNGSKEEEVFLGNIPWMTDREAFVLDGIERVIVVTCETGDDQEEPGLARFPASFLRALSDPLEAGLSQAKAVIGEVLASATTQRFELNSVADFLPVGRLLTDGLRAHPCAQVCDATNPLSSLTHQRRVSALGPGSPSPEKAGFAIRNAVPTHFGRFCYLETPEGPNIGLINSLALHAEIGDDGLIRTPYLKVEEGKVTDKVEKLTAAQEEEAVICGADAPIDDEGRIDAAQVMVRKEGTFVSASPSEAQYMAVSPSQGLGLSTSLIPFLAHDDANRVLMGANMQRQAVPLLWGEAPLVCSGMEAPIAEASQAVTVAEHSGTVTQVSGDSIRIAPAASENDADKAEEHRLKKFRMTAERTCLNERALVAEGEAVEPGQPIAETSCSDGGQLALGRNLLVAFMPWEGYNFEDGVIISERVVRDDLLTSLNISTFSIEARETSDGNEEIARPSGAPDTLDERGIVAVGASVSAGDILIGKTLRRGSEAEDRSLRLREGAEGRVLRTVYRSRENGDSLPGGVLEAVEVEIAQLREVEVGDKLSNRHGAKGVVTKVVPVEDMPYLPDGTPVDVLLNPLGVPSRMNLGQILETHLGWAAAKLNRRIVTPPLCGADLADIEAALKEAGLPESGATILHDGRNGKPFDYEITVGALYMLKLNHMVADKLHARAIGPYSLQDRQPTGGKARFGGQRFGEMETWAAEAYGAGQVLRELLTVKSDDAAGRQKLLKALSEGHGNVETGGVPHSAKALIAQLRGVGLQVELGGANGAADGRRVRISLASPDAIREQSSGQVTTTRLLDEGTNRPAEGGLFCEKIFGPHTVQTAEEAACGLDPSLPDEALASADRMGHIELAVPVCHPWVFGAVPELMAGLLGIDQETLDDVVHYRKPGGGDLGAGGAAVRQALESLDVAEAKERLSGEARGLLEAFLESGGRLEWTVLDAVPVIPPAFRPMIQDGGEVRLGDLNELYVRLLTRNEACRKAIEQGAPEIIVREKARGVQEAVEMLFGNGVKRAHVGPDYDRVSVASLSDMIRSRENPLRTIGKRVDFSGRSVIVVGPELKLNQVGLPKRMARELFRPFVTAELVKSGTAKDEARAAEMLRAGDPEADRALEKVMAGRVVLLNRAPTIHRYGLQAFEPVLVDHKAIAIHPLVCLPFNADFDGDQMAVHLPLSDAAQAEARSLMMPVQNLLSSRSGEPIAGCTQDIVLGLSYLTAEKKGAKGAGLSFPDREAAIAAFESGEIALHAPIEVADGAGKVTTTAGRLILHSALPEGSDLVNEQVNRRRLDELMVSVFGAHGAETTAEMLDRLKTLGFRYAMRYGASIGKDRLKLYSRKAKVMSRLRSEEEKIRQERAAGTVSDHEAAERWLDLWTDTTHHIMREVMDELAADWDGFNPAYLMHVSGARGNAIQLRQLNGIRGLMVTASDTHSKLASVPSSFMEGLTPWEHFISSFGARRGLMDSALKVADAGYLERKLVWRAEDVRIEQEDCGTDRFLTLEPLRHEEAVIEDLPERAFGRIAAQDVLDPKTGEKIVGAGELIDKPASEKIGEAGVGQVAARSVLCCESETGVCARCYGSAPGTGGPAKVGDAVGMIAAHSIGAPAIQLTLQTFYVAQPSKKRAEPVKGGLPRLAELEKTGAEMDPADFVSQCTAIYREQGVRIHDKHFEILARSIHHPPTQGFLARTAKPPVGETPTGVLTKAALRAETDLLLGQRERVFFGL